VLFNLTFTRPLMAEYPTLSQAVEQAHSELWSRLVDSHGIIRDFVGELPTPKDCTACKGVDRDYRNGTMYSCALPPSSRASSTSPRSTA
jgi:hypothetical protein